MLLLGGYMALAVPEPCIQEVKDLYGSQRYVESARQADACWARTKESLLLYFAAQARANAGHVTQAIVALRAYLAQLPAGAPQRDTAEEQLRELLPRTQEVTLDAPAGPVFLLYAGRDDRLDLAWPGGPGPLHLELGTWRVWASSQDLDRATKFTVLRGQPTKVRIERVLAPPPPSPPVRVPVQVLLDPWRPGAVIEWQREGSKPWRVGLVHAKMTLPLELGRWRAVVRVPGREPLTQEVEVRGSQALVFRPGLSRATRVGVGLGVGLGAGALALMIGGVSGSIEGRAKYLDAVVPSMALSGYDRQIRGLGMIGAATGVMVGALTTGLQADKKAFFAEFGVGGALALGGAIGVGLTRATSRDFEPERSLYPGDTVAALSLGAGLGLVGAAGLGFLARWLAGRTAEPARRLEPIVLHSAAGLHGRF